MIARLPSIGCVRSSQWFGAAGWRTPVVQVGAVWLRTSVRVRVDLGDVDRGEQDEDVGLQERDQYLERGEQEEHEEGGDRDHLDQSLAVEEQELTAQREQQQQDVPGEHVAED